MMDKNKKEKKYVISSEQLQKMERAARRKIDLERNSFIRGGPHKTSKKDIETEISNKVSPQELDEIIEEYSEDYEDYYEDYM